MKFSIEIPVDHIQAGPEFVGQAAMREMAEAAEEAGFEACHVTDHPCPTGRWLDAGGHFAQDPFVMLTAIAMVTRRIRLQTGLLVLPYRNPFLVARAVSSLDVLSGGRVILGVGAGYLKGEFRALGTDFETRNERMDEAIQALKAAWTNDEFSFEGSDFSARGARILPRPVQQPHPPIWIGGNSKRAIRRAVDLAEGWMPFEATDQVAATARTVALQGEEDWRERIDYMKDYLKASGRTQPLDIVVNTGVPVTDPGAFRARIPRYAALGASWVTVKFPATTRKTWCESARNFGREILASGAAA